VVARDVGGVAEVLDEAGAGRVVPRTAAAEAWGAVLAEELAGPAVPAAVRAAVVERYSVARLVEDLAALYCRELARA
jgi:glycosyltransferase involved in cell wall biosynthesis